ncbi:MAG: hypothetical protein WC467_03515 [Patescibacteria group bacterium]
MISEPKQFSDQFNNLSPEVQFYFSQEISGQAILSLANEYKIGADRVYDLVFSAVNTNFDFVSLHKEINMLNLAGTQINGFFRDFIGRILMPISPYIKTEEIKNELVRSGGKPEDYQKYVSEFFEVIEDNNFKELEEAIALHEKTVDPKEEKIYALDLFSNNLVELLSVDSPEATATLNGGLIYLLNNDGGFKNEALRVLLASEELLSANHLSLDDREVAPSVSNWLKDFIKINGSEIFDELVLAQYLSTSHNAKNLNKIEKELLRKLLQLYRNLAFFPESMAKRAVEEWQIIPAEKAVGPRVVQDALTEPRAVETPPQILSPLEELKADLVNYTPGSLEYKAVAQEIERLKKKK